MHEENESQPATGANEEEEEIRRKLEWFFKTPFEKYKERGRKPYKFLLQIIKIIVITVQATLFAVDEFSLVTFHKNSVTTFRNAFIPDYAGLPVRKLYSKDDVYRHIMYAWNKYYTFSDFNPGPYKFLKSADGAIEPIRFCKTWNDKVRNIVEPTDSDGNLNSGAKSEKSKIQTECQYLKPPFGNGSSVATLEEFVAVNQLPSKVGWVLSMWLEYSLRMNYSLVHQDFMQDCYQFNINLLLDNQDLDGIMLISLGSRVDFRICRAQLRDTAPSFTTFRSSQSFLDVILLVLCTISMCLCVRSFRKHYIVYSETTSFFRSHYADELQFSDSAVFINCWMVMMVCSDVCALAGSCIKILIDLFEHPELYTCCSLLFGVAVLFAWIGVLRNLGYIQVSLRI